MKKIPVDHRALRIKYAAELNQFLGSTNSFCTYNLKRTTDYSRHTILKQRRINVDVTLRRIDVASTLFWRHVPAWLAHFTVN